MYTICLDLKLFQNEILTTYSVLAKLVKYYPKWAHLNVQSIKVYKC